MAAPAPLRVLNVIGSMNIGGAERYVSRVAPLIRSYGVRLDICTLERSGVLLDELERSGVTVHGTRFAMRRRSATPLRLLPTLARTIQDIARITRAGRYDVVQTYLFLADVVGTAGAKAGGCPRIIVSRRALHAWRHAPNLPEHLVELGCNVFAHELIANSRAVLRDVERYEQLLPRLRTVIYNGIDVEGLPVARPAATGPLRLVTVGALAPRKGQEYAIEALAMVRAAGVDARLTVVGAGPDEGLLRRRAQTLQLESEVVFAGEGDPRPHLAEADIFVLPSRQEGFSNALIEAMGSGLPAVVTDVGGNAEAVVEGSGGRVVAPEDPRALGQAVIELAADRGSLPEMGEFNRRVVAQKFTLEASVRELAAWYLRNDGIGHQLRSA